MTQNAAMLALDDGVIDSPTARAEAALTHPATLIALATLLANDLVFKSLWPGSWITGKLSDLAWVIFAPPLIALPLTFLARRNQNARLTAWAIAYIGLPLLYFGYNSFEPLHDAVMGLFSVLRGTPGGSPFDPTDSIVIPFGSAIAIWVWCNADPISKAAQMRMGLLLAVLASLASIATSYEPPYEGVVAIEADDDGNPTYKHSWNWYEGVGNRFVATPRGTYTIRHGTEIHRSYNGKSEIVFSTTIKNKTRDSIALQASTINLGYRSVLAAPYSIYYDEKSGNVILAMGLQGVIIGKPDGTWKRIPVGDLKPLDYSIASRLSTLFGIIELIFISVGLAASFTMFTLFLTTRSSIVSWKGGLMSLAALIPVGVSIIALMQFTGNRDPNDSYYLPTMLVMLTPVLAWMIPTPFIPLIFLSSKLKNLTAGIAVAVAFIGMVILSEFAFFLWVDGIIDLDSAKLWALLLTAAAAVTLGVWTVSHVRNQRDDATDHGPADEMQ